MAKLFACSFKVGQCTQVPEGFGVAKGSRSKAAAMCIADGEASGFLAYTFAADTTLEKARSAFLKMLVPGGTIGLKFPQKKIVLDRVFEHGDDWVAPVFTPAEICFDEMGLLRASDVAVLLQAPVANARDDYATLGLLPGAGREQIRTAWQTAARKHHPDRGGCPEKFRVAQDAYERLTSTASGSKVLLHPIVPPALGYEESPETLRSQWLAARDKVKSLEDQLVAARRHEAATLKVYGEKSNDVYKATRREKAQEFTKQFRCSAKYWKTAELMRWFRPDQGFYAWTDTPAMMKKKAAKWFEQYGPEDLRSGNEDLDPHCKLRAWCPCVGGNPMCLAVRVKVGMDCIDAVDWGPELTMEFHRFCGGAAEQHRAELKLLSFDEKIAYEQRTPSWRQHFDVAYYTGPADLELDGAQSSEPSGAISSAEFSQATRAPVAEQEDASEEETEIDKEIRAMESARKRLRES